MDWPELVEALKPLGFREFRDGHRLYHETPTDYRRIYGGTDGRAEVVDYFKGPLFAGPYADVVAYLQKVEKEKKP